MSQEINTKRVTVSRGAMLAAGKRVADKITVETMNQSFPSFVQDHADFIAILASETANLLNESFEHAWVNLSTKGAFSQFIPLANAFDRIEADAEARKERGEAPLDLVRKGADPTLTFPAKTNSMLKQELENLSSLRAELANSTKAKVASSLKRAEQASDIEKKVRLKLKAVQQTSDMLAKMDKSELHTRLLLDLQEGMPAQT